jgi:hypothetical protein
MDTSELIKMAQILKNLQVGGQAMDVGKAGTMYQGRLGYQFDPLENGNAFNIGASGMGFANNPYNIPSKVTGLDLSYGNQDQMIKAGYYPNKSQFMGEPIGPGGFSLQYMKAFD